MEEGGEQPKQTINSNNEEERDEEFYEKIEAPKFVDFTKPDPFRPDDRYWFCLRVGCDQKHEEEIDPEEISKNFVLRVMAARSPNIKLRRALNGKNSSMNMKCPLSAPAKSSKSRISRLAMVSSISHKKVDPKEKVRPPSNASSTPMAKSNQVAAKYMTTPRNRKCLPNSNSFRSVQNPKPSNVVVPKNRMVAKALVFHSHKKATSVKKSVELHTPLTKICEGMKRLEITSQKKPSQIYPSRRQLRVCKDERSKDLLHPQNCKEQGTTKSSKSIKTRRKQILTKQCHSLNEKVVENDSSDMINEGNVYKEHQPTLSTTGEFVSTDSTEEQTIIISSEEEPTSKEILDNERSTEDHSNVHQSLEEEAVHESGQMDTDDKENAMTSDENRELNLNCNNQPGKKILGSQETLKNNKVVRAVDKNLKGGLTKTGAGTIVVKYKKPKPTNVKPFRLRTDERGILKVAAQKEAAKDSGFPVVNLGSHQKNEPVSSSVMILTPEFNTIVELKISRAQVGQKLATSQRRSESTHRELKSITSRYLQQQLVRPQGVASSRKVINSYLRPGQKLSVIKENSSKLTKPKEEVELDGSGASSASRSTSRGKRPVTIPKEPNFHSSHVPKSCARKIA